MLNRHGPAGQKLIAPYDGNIGRIEFEDAKPELEKVEIYKEATGMESQSGSRKFIGNNLG